jgi:uncharacterized protein
MQTVEVEKPTHDECTMAMLANILQIFTGFIGPLIMFAVKRDSKFVAFHSLQALLWQIAWGLVAVLIAMGWVILIFVGVAVGAAHPQTNSDSVPPMVVGFIGFFGLFWLFMIAAGIANLVLAVYHGIKSSQGEWTAYPLVGRLARRWV